MRFFSFFLCQVPQSGLRYTLLPAYPFIGDSRVADFFQSAWLRSWYPWIFLPASRVICWDDTLWSLSYFISLQDLLSEQSTSFLIMEHVLIIQGSLRNQLCWDFHSGFFHWPHLIVGRIFLLGSCAVPPVLGGLLVGSHSLAGLVFFRLHSH